jgi:8-oxo-dGTP pyrophosphatase MutT (NUDIX family)
MISFPSWSSAERPTDSAYAIEPAGAIWLTSASFGTTIISHIPYTLHCVNNDYPKLAKDFLAQRFHLMLISYGARNRLIERLRRLFGGLPRRVQAAALPWRQTDSGIEVLLVTSRGSKRWITPKGWPENNERLHQAAAREAAEEAGVDGAVAEREIGRFYYGKQMKSGLRWRCEVPVFPIEVSQLADKWPERKKRTRQWFSPQEAARVVEEGDLGELIIEFGVNPRKYAA